MEENQNNVVNNNQENDENKKKKKIVVWWNNLGKGVRTAICVLGGVAVATAVVVPTVFGVKACTNTQRKYSVNSEEVNFTGKLENDTFEGTITVKDTNKEISNLVIKIGDYTLKDTEYTFDDDTGKLIISSDVIKAHNGDIVITPTVADKAVQIIFNFYGESEYKYFSTETLNLTEGKRYFFDLDMSEFTDFTTSSFEIYTSQNQQISNAKSYRYTYKYLKDIGIKSNTQIFSKLPTKTVPSEPYTFAFNSEEGDGSKIIVSKNSFSTESNHLKVKFTNGATYNGLSIFVALEQQEQ